MANSLDEIWQGDLLGRRGEAADLERFLNDEAGMMQRANRDESFVLALDAQYGEGKSWFLDRLRSQLALNHPVCFVDAWVDDAGNEPLVSLMASLEQGLKPFLTAQTVKDRLGALTRAALPIIGRGAIGAAGQLAKRYLGTDVLEHVQGVSAAAPAANPVPATGHSHESVDPLGKGIEELAAGVSQVVDHLGGEMIAQYNKRRTSREAFRTNLAALAASIDQHEDPRASPIFVIVDELDRCRPTYAIALLEEVKHLFDVPGVVFIIAMHGEQLTHSIAAIYGQAFDSRSYLRRFFTRSYRLRRLSIRELVASRFTLMEWRVRFAAPPLFVNGKEENAPPAQLTGDLLFEWGVTAREALAIVDALRLFALAWEHEVPIELPLLLVLLLHFIRNERPQLALPPPPAGCALVQFAVRGAPTNDGSQLVAATSRDFLQPYAEAMAADLSNFVVNRHSRGPQGYVDRQLADEARLRGGKVTGMRSRWADYGDVIQAVRRFVSHDPPRTPDV